MWKKILILVLVLIIAGAGGFGTYYFYRANENQISQNQMLMSQNAQVQAQLDAIGALTTVFEVAHKTYSGKQILDSDLIEVSVPVSTLQESSITNRSDLVGKYYRVNVNPGTILSKDMLMDESNEGKPKFNREITVSALPVSTVVGDYIDIRFILANGEEYIVFSHKQIKKLYGNTITLFLNEEENTILNSLFADLGQYNGVCLAYITKYLEPGNDTDTVAFYPVQKDMENFIRFNPNIKDVTRCINESLRDHIDEVLLVYSDSVNQSAAQAGISMINTQIASGGTAQSLWVEEHTSDDGEFTGDDDFSTTTPTVYDDSQSFDQTVGEATESLNENLNELQDLEEIK